MTAVAPIRVLLADDQALIRLGFRMVLSSAPDIELVGEAETGSFAVDLTAALHPDVVLMDVRMPGMDGIEATRRIVSGTPHSRVLILTTFDLDEYAFAGLNAGASGFLLKDAEPPELIGAIRTVARGDAVIAPRLVLSEATVKTHLGRILTKLELRDRVQAVVFAYRNQLVDERPD